MTPEQRDLILDKVEERLTILPWYVAEFIHYRSDASPNTLDSYTRDYVGFFNWLVTEGFHPGPMKDIRIVDLEKLKVQDIISYEQYLIRRRRNKIDTVARKLASLKSLFHYLSQIAEDENMYPYMHRNVMAKIEIKKERISETKRAEMIARRILIDEEINEFRLFIAHEYGKIVKEESKRKYNAYLRNKERDLALISLLLGSGLRISEALSIDIDTIDWRRNQADIVRKGDSLDIVTFSDIAARDMKTYAEIREERYKPAPNEKAFFLSWRTGKGGKVKRLTVRAAQKMFEKYAWAFGRSKLSLHKLRHTFATNHYKENKDIALLKRILDHANIDTTMIYTHVFDAQIRQSINKADS